jgi:hypothetical protein
LTLLGFDCRAIGVAFRRLARLPSGIRPALEGRLVGPSRKGSGRFSGLSSGQPAAPETSRSPLESGLETITGIRITGRKRPAYYPAAPDKARERAYKTPRAPVALKVCRFRLTCSFVRTQFRETPNSRAAGVSPRREPARHRQSQASAVRRPTQKRKTAAREQAAGRSRRIECCL